MQWNYGRDQKFEWAHRFDVHDILNYCPKGPQTVNFKIHFFRGCTNKVLAYLFTRHRSSKNTRVCQLGPRSEESIRPQIKQRLQQDTDQYKWASKIQILPRKPKKFPLHNKTIGIPTQICTLRNQC